MQRSANDVITSSVHPSELCGKRERGILRTCVPSHPITHVDADALDIDNGMKKFDNYNKRKDRLNFSSHSLGMLPLYMYEYE